MDERWSSRDYILYGVMGMLFAIFNAIVIIGIVVPIALILANLAKEDKKDKEE